MPANSLRVWLVALGVIVATVTCASADVVMLRNGGELRGQLRSAPDAPVVVVETLLGGTISFDQSSIVNIETRPLLTEEYESRARDCEDTVAAHGALAEWCRSNGLNEEREEQLSLVLDLDPQQAGARKALGHVRHQGRWMTRDEWMTKRGYVLDDGKYVTLREHQRRLLAEQMRGANAEWYPKVRTWFRLMMGGSPQGVAEAQAHFKALTDPDAAPAVVNFFSGHSDGNVRMMGVQLLGQMSDSRPAEALVRISMVDSDHEIRIAARQAIPPEQRSHALGCYQRELQSKTPLVVTRAAAGIGDIGDRSAVPYLIPALVTRQYALCGFSTYCQSSNCHGSRSRILLRRDHVTVRPCYLENPTVLEALIKLTGQDFGYNERVWAQWWQSQGEPQAAPGELAATQLSPSDLSGPHSQSD